MAVNLKRSVFVLDSCRFKQKKETIQKNFCKYWGAVLRHDIKEKWRLVKTQKPAPRGKPFRLRSDIPKRIREKYLPMQGNRVSYKGVKQSSWAKRMEFGGETIIKLGWLLPAAHFHYPLDDNLWQHMDGE